jgi:erythronate-4-phosphate dehydrogenase
MINQPLRIIADNQIVGLDQLADDDITLVKLPPKDIVPARLKEADILFVRSVTSVDAKLLNDSAIRFVGSATAGIDHLDTAYLDRRDIAWANAPGCNANAVADYVLIAIAHLRQNQALKTTTGKAGVIGVGQVGRRVSDRLKKLGFDVLENDPPRAAQNRQFQSATLEQLYDCDLICLHTPLTKAGPHPTYHLINHDFLSRWKKNGVLINAGRGAVIDSAALLHRKQCTLVLDVWEHEPNINPALVKLADIATPHIAGYSDLAKLRATNQLLHAVCQCFNRPYKNKVTNTTASQTTIDLSSACWYKEVIAKHDLITLSNQLKSALINPAMSADSFQQLRKNYPLRDEIALK